MEVSRLRQLWSLIEQTQTHILLQLSDNDLSEQLLQQLENREPLSPEQIPTITTYIRNKTSLIRDLAEARKAYNHQI